MATTITVYGNIQKRNADMENARQRRSVNSIDEYQQYNIEVFVNGLESKVLSKGCSFNHMLV